jgi:uncharacterized membrane protein
VVEPGAVFVFLMGIGLIVTRGYNPLGDLWLALSIVLFLITLGFANLVQPSMIKKMIALTSQPPPAVSEAAEAGAGTAGPPPGFLELSQKAVRGGQFMLLMLFTIVALMVVKPF